MIEHHADCAPLLELATPQIYRRNLFRVLRLPVDVTARDVQRQQTRRKIQEKLGIASSEGQVGPLALEPAPTDEDVRAAMERLNRPVDRLLDEVFWFWPTNGSGTDDPALKALEEGQVKEAAELWMEQAKLDGQGQIANHNLAVLDHLVALDYEARLASQDSDKKQQKRLADLWLRAFARWKQVLDGEEFWSVVKSRVRYLDDVQLTTGFVRRIRSTLPTALLLINAKIAYGAAERSDAALTQRHIRLLREASLGDGLADEAIRESLKPMRNRIRTATDNAKSRWTRTPHHGNQHIRELYEHAKGLLAVVDIILPEGNLTRAGLHDMVAEAMLEGQITFGNKTNDWQECINLLELARELAPGDTVRSRLSENIEILQNNARQGNDWCCPGYWALPQEIITQLEAAREKADGGDLDGAIQALTVLDPKIGKPLRRCLAYCLSIKGISVGNDAASEFNVEKGVVKKILDKLRGMGEERAAVALMNRPDPHSDGFMNPPCLSCGSSHYTSWVIFTFRDIPLFMCSACNSKHEREVEQQKSALRRRVGTALEYLLLADEVDPGDAGVRTNLKSLKKMAREINCSIPKTKALKERLGAEKTRGMRHKFEPSAEDYVCHFCGESSADDSCRIMVPMCGDLQPVDLLFQKGIEYRHADVVVPRCRRCRDEHRELPGRIEKWHDARLAAADDENFPEVLAEVKSAEPIARQAVARVEKEKKKVSKAQAALEKAESAGNQCDQCHSAKSWHQYICQRCDKKVLRLPWHLVAVAVTLTLAAMYPLVSALGAPLVSVVFIPLLIGLGLTGILNQMQRVRRRKLRDKRAAETQERRKLVPHLQAELNRAKSALKTAAEAAKAPVEAYKGVRKKLEAAKQKAIDEFESLYPEPKLAAGVKPEDGYLEFARIRKLREQGWGFGSEPEGDGENVAGSPVSVVGLVAREPCPVTERVVMSCPECGKHYRVPRSDELLRAKCQCGYEFLLRQGVAHERRTSGTPSSKPAKSTGANSKAGSGKLPVANGYQCPACGSYSNSISHRVTKGLVVDCKACGQRFINGAA